MRIEPIQYAEENVDTFFNQIFSIDPTTYHRLFTAQKIDDLKEFISNQFYYIFLVGYWEDEEATYCIAHYEWQYELHRKLVIDYLTVKQPHLYMSTLYRVTEYLWMNDPCQEIEMVMFKNEENAEGLKVIDDV